MKNYLAIILSTSILLGGMLFPAFGQSMGDNVVINEVDINPPGDDSLTVNEWVELYNPTDSPIDVGGWKIASTTILKKTFTIPQGTTINPGGFLTYSYTKVWFTDVSELVELRDSDGNVIDATPVITDVDNNFSSWQRIYDGFDTNAATDWKFATSSAGSTNGKLVVEEEEESVTVSVDVNKSEFLFGETAYISGSVSEKVFVEKPYFQAAPIKITINGPNFFKEVTLYPDLNLNYKTTLSLQKVLGVYEGIYDVNVDYAGSLTQTKFSVGEQIIEIPEEESSDLSISFDSASYIPGQTAIITAKASKVIPYEGLKFKVVDPNGIQIFDGTLYPNPKGEFTTNIFMTTVSPTFGMHTIEAEYSTLKAKSSFELLKDIKEDKPISLFTDKPVYGLGETVKISGRVNNVWIPTLDIEIKQVGTQSFSTQGGNFLKDLNSVSLAGDSSFNYNFKIPTDSIRLGEYSVKVSKDIGDAIIYFKVVSNPEEYVQGIEEPFTLSTDKTEYLLGDKILISGKINQKQISSSFYTSSVTVSITKADGTPITSSTFKPSGNKATSTTYSLTAVPDTAGNYKLEDTLSQAIFDEGDYIVKANYADGTLKASRSFSIIDPLKIENYAQLSINKDIFGLGENVIVDGIIPGLSQGSGITIKLYKPDGDTDTFGALADNSRFSWTWKIPIAEKSNIITTNERVVLSTNYGVYRVIFSTDSGSVDIFFKVSPDPENDTLVVLPIEVSTDQPIYKSGQTLTVLGSAQKRVQGTEGLVVQERAHIVIQTTDFPIKQIYDAFVYLDAGGNFKSSFVLPVTIFKEGNYKVIATYLTHKAETIFAVDNEFLVGGDEKLALLIDTNKDQYTLGEPVHITGRPNKLVYLDKVDITIVHESQSQITCGSFVCGTPGKTVSVVPSASGSFNYDYIISTSASAKGNYEIIADTDFGKFPITFVVTDEPTIIETPTEIEAPVLRTTEKFNRISDSLIPITTTPIELVGEEMLPRVIQGSMLTATRGEEPNVNLKVTTESGLCIIGQDTDCMVSESTRSPGQIYEIVTIDDVNYKVRYSGPDVRLEKFTILPESDDATLPESTWNVEIIKEEDQVSRFYYKITRIASE